MSGLAVVILAMLCVVVVKLFEVVIRAIVRSEIKIMNTQDQAIIDGLNADAAALKQALADKDTALASKDATIASLTAELATATASAEDPAFIAGLAAAKSSLDALVPAPVAAPAIAPATPGPAL